MTPVTEPVPASGRQVELRHGDQHVVVVTTGAAVRVFTDGGREVVVPFEADQVSPAFHGAVLAPWPNRLEDGAYAFAGREHRTPISEPGRGTALHGLVAWVRWDVEAADETHARLSHRLPASPGYPSALLLTVDYDLGADGLTVTTTARNEGTAPAPYGLGFHPWLSPGPGGVDASTLQVAAATHVVNDERLHPVGTDHDPAHDWRTARPLRDVRLDDAYVDVERGDDGLSWARLTGDDGRTVAVWMDEACTAWQVCTGDAIDDDAQRRTGVAVEPMTCIANAFRTGDDLVVLQPGDVHRVRWGLALR